MNTFDSLHQQLRNGETTCEHITESYLHQIEQKRHLNVFRSLFAEQATERARSIDKKLSHGTAGQLAGMVIAIKDVMNIKDHPTTCGSKILENFISPYDATIVKKLLDADAIIIGKTNMDEFAMGSSTENSAYGVVLNPIDETRVPGGSSGGSAVAVAANLSRTSLGSDTGGSIRQPASFCGIVGLKPTYGRVSRFGLVAFASSFDQIGPFGSCVRDVAHILNVIAGHDEHDSTSANIPVPNYLEKLTGNVQGLRIGLPKEYFADELDTEIRNAIMQKVELLKQHGAEVKEISLPHTEYTIAVYYILTTAEASSNLAR
ncbi:MAG: Asp-tRNA(Asn)/Glu-tRNA(Gln) amidotransferase subunit GatA, partial [Ignavibacteriales bacterium]|nr:Asp-tRNA(Asn)/Glu-tRNA(Gln) amidotransferase subunit GatA [Ignavibacteriales bacterium]